MNKEETIDELFEAVGLKKAIYKHLEDIDLDAVYSFCKSESFGVIVSGYLSTEGYSQNKTDRITAFISEHVSKDIGSIASIGEIEYLVLDLDFLYYALPYFKEFIETKEIHELHYILKKGIISNSKEKTYSNKNYLQNLFYHTGEFYDDHDDFFKRIVNKVNVETLIQPKRCIEYCYSNESMLFSSDWKGRPNAPQEVVSILKFASNKLLSNKALFKQLINRDYYLIRYLDKKINNDKILFKSARRIWLRITQELISEGNFININKYYPLQYFSLKDNREIALLSVSDKGENLKIVDKSLQDDDLIVLEAVNNYGLALEYASDRLKKNEIIVHTAVYNTGDALEYASERLRDDEQIVLTAINGKRYLLKFASTRLKNKYGYDEKKRQ